MFKIVRKALRKIKAKAAKKAYPIVWEGGYSYQNISYLQADYCPWYMDDKFMKVYSQIKNNTLVDVYRCWELWELLYQTKKCHEGGNGNRCLERRYGCTPGY